MTVQEAYKQLSLTLQAIYERREANQIASLVIESHTGYNNTERIVYRDVLFTRQQQTNLHYIILDLLNQKPVQYVLEEAHWHGMKLYVNEHVLIPRPETEELVSWCIESVKERAPTESKVLDIGTGSGCIAVAIKKELPSVQVFAADVSGDALQVASQNAEAQGVELSFIKTDILIETQWTELPSFHCIISNPPYIAEREAGDMKDNVLRFEPHLALFVPNDYPLLFYDVISSFGLRHLYHSGLLFFEIHESFGNEVAGLLSAKGYRNVELRKDMQGKDRMIKGEKD